MTQDELLQSIKRRDERALAFLYDNYAPSLFAVISDIVRDRAQAEELLQETFVKIWKTAEKFDPSKERFYTWMVRIARSNAIDKAKTSTSENFVHLHDNNVQAAGRIDAIGTREFVKNLKPKCIQLIELLFFRGQSRENVASTMEISPEMVQNQNRNCISDLRNYLQV